MSPVLFAIYIADIMWRLKRKEVGVSVGEETVPGLMFADDMAFVGDEKNMREILKEVGEFAQDNAIEFSGPKSLVIPVNGPVRPDRKWQMGVVPYEEDEQEKREEEKGGVTAKFLAKKIFQIIYS